MFQNIPEDNVAEALISKPRSSSKNFHELCTCDNWNLRLGIYLLRQIFYLDLTH